MVAGHYIKFAFRILNRQRRTSTSMLGRPLGLFPDGDQIRGESRRAIHPQPICGLFHTSGEVPSSRRQLQEGHVARTILKGVSCKGSSEFQISTWTHLVLASRELEERKSIEHNTAPVRVVPQVYVLRCFVCLHAV